MARLLISEGAKINMKIGIWKSCLSYSLASFRMDMAIILIKGGADVNVVEQCGRTAFHFADQNGWAEPIIQQTVLCNPEATKSDYVTNNPKLSEYWDSQIKKEIFLLNNKGIFNQMLDSKYVINRDDPLDKLTSDAENFLKETQEKFGIVINPAEFIEYRVEKRYPASLKALTFGNVPFECYEELSGGILDGPNVEQSKVGKAIG
ncbi:hypothetical protein [Wolbachia endosymbiont (group E) of Neria commutata]|uniref:hypothetical protein n=1 Tax=Wolbachia endosymbiont (group E) of Neria commutata TaxID=3066149 RepID=UPI0039793BD8